ncbi:MAG: O-antigen ligase family protein [Firmicutes bacterium]|nr:O-antigen ligase family protein [Bacillota bacterium]
MIAKIKYKFQRMLERGAELSTDEKIITVCVMAIFLPLQLVSVPALFAVFRALLNKTIREKMTAVSFSGYIYISIFIFTFPAIMFRNWFGLFGGVVIWLALIFMLYLFSIMTVRFYNNLIDLVLILSLFAMAYAIIDKFFFGHARTESVFSNANYYGYMIEIFVILALYRYEKRHSTGYLIILFANLGGILLCDCRTAWAALGVALLFYAIHYKRSVKWVVITMLIAVVIMLIILNVPLFSERLAGDVLDNDVDKRSKIWQTAIEWIKKQPIFGYGMNSFREICIRTNAKRIRWHAHNLILNVILDFGVIGLAYFSCMIGKIVSVLNKPQFCVSYGAIRTLIMIVALATMIHGVTDVPVLGVQTSLMLVLVISGCSVERNERVFKRLRNFCEINKA